MRARAAYIRSLGTTSILVAAAVLMLSVVGALVGFHGWPQGAVGETVRSVPFQAPQTVVRAVPDVRRTIAARSGRVAGRASTAGLVKVVRVGTEPVGSPVALAPDEATPGASAPAPPNQAQNQQGGNGLQMPGGPPPDPRQLQALIDEIVASVPPPPPTPAGQPAQQTQVGVPVVGVTVTVPPPTSAQ